MSDQSKYVNTYIEHSIGMIHEYVSLVLQARTQAKIANDMASEKDAIISSLEEQVNAFKSELENTRSELNKTVTSSNEQVNQSRADASKWENEYNAMKAKAEHVDTFSNQINEMKKILQEKNEEIQRLETSKNEEIQRLEKKLENFIKPKSTKTSAPKKVINTEDKREEPIVMKVPEPEDKNDDF